LVVDHLHEQAGRPINQRKWRLFLIACVRRVCHIFKDERTLKLVETVEQRADDVITQEQLDRLWLAAAYPLPNEDSGDPDDCPPEKRAAACAASALGNAVNQTVQAFEAYCGAGWAAEAADDSASEQEAQMKLLHDIIGNPFRPVSLDPAWLEWNAGTVRRLAQAAYDARHLPAGTLDPGRLAVLADALEEAGCDNKGLLTHLRGPGLHVRGCWAVDLLLSKE
jgi:hypothetical protein